MDTTGYCGSVFDGRYVYFAPQHDTKERHGKVLRYDTHKNFQSPTAWSAYNGNNTDKLKTRGFVSAIFDGRYVYFIPRYNGEDFKAHFLRYDTYQSFKSPKSWSAYDSGLDGAFQGAGFDGRYIYCVPGTNSNRTRNDMVSRYDTNASFTDAKSWCQFDIGKVCGFKSRGGGIGFDGAVFDGRYMYFSPLLGVALRYDTSTEFTNSKSWQAFHPKTFKIKRNIGAVFDGRFIYFVPYSNNSEIVRYDIKKPFNDEDSWSVYNAEGCSGLNTIGYDGGVFDGRFVYFIPFYNGKKVKPATKAFHGNVLRYDTLGDFLSRASWTAIDAGKVSGLDTRGYSAGSFDGRFIYFAPWHAGEADQYSKGPGLRGHGRALRYDTTGNNATFLLKYVDYGHNGGLGGSLPGTTFLVNTDQGAISVSSNGRPLPGRHHVVGVYDGKNIQLFLDGKLINKRKSNGIIINNNQALGVGKLLKGGGKFKGKIESLGIYNVAKSAEWIESQFKQGK